MKKISFILAAVLFVISSGSADVVIVEMIDDFTADTLDPAWVVSEVGGTGTRPTFTTTLVQNDVLNMRKTDSTSAIDTLLRTDYSLGIGQTLVTTPIRAKNNTYTGLMIAPSDTINNMANCLWIAQTPTTGDNGIGNIIVFAVDGPDLDVNKHYGLADNGYQFDTYTVLQQYIKRLSETTYDAGYIDASGAHSVLTYTFTSGTNPGAAIGYYCDMRANQYNLYDDLAYAVVADPNANAEFGQTATAPVIDGAYDAAWADAKIYYSIYNLTADSNSLTSWNNDLRVRYRGMWDAANLYLLVEVVDDVLYRDSGSDGANDDSIEIYTDVYKVQRVYASGDPNVFQTGLAIETSGPYPKTITPYSGSVNPATGTYKMVVNAGSYVLEAAIPWVNISDPDYTPVISDRIGFGLAVNDDDTGGDRNSRLLWATDSALLWENSIYFPEVQLVATAPAQSTCWDAINAGFGLPGDTNYDCVVNLDDLADVAASWLKNAQIDL